MFFGDDFAAFEEGDLSVNCTGKNRERKKREWIEAVGRRGGKGGPGKGLVRIVEMRRERGSGCIPIALSSAPSIFGNRDGESSHTH